MGERNVGRALTVGQANEDIRFVEDDESSNDRHPPKIPAVSISLQPQTATVEQRLQISREGSYAEIASQKTLSPPTSRYGFSKSKEKIRAEPVQKTRRKSDLVLNIFSRTPSVKKNHKEYEKVSTREDSTYSNIVESPSLIKTPHHGSESGFRLRSFAGYEIKRSELNAEDDEQTLEVLRQVVRKCTNPDPMKRPSSIDVMDLVRDTP